MKKFFTLFFAVISAAALSAQETKSYFQFADKDGNIIPDGTTIVRDVPETDDFGTAIIHSGLYIKNVEAPEDTPLWLVSNITKIDNGTLQVCFPQNCISYNRVSSNTSGATTIASGNQADIQSEWLPTAYGECVVTYTATPLEKFGKTYIENEGPSVTVRYILPDPAGIHQKNVAKATPVATYDAQGRLTSSTGRGIRIVRMSDGTVRKVIGQ